MGYRRSAYRHTVIINLKSGTSIRGVLYTRRRPLLVLKEAAQLVDARQETSIDGDVLVREQDVDYIQVLPTGEYR